MDDEPDWEFSERDICILKELSRDPQLSSRKLADRLEEKYDIDVSHVTVSESVRKMREEGVFRDAILINEAYFNFSLIEFKFNTSKFADKWKEAMEHIRDDRAVFRHFARALRPGGHVVINTPSDQGGSDVQSDADESFIGEHVRDGYNRNDLEAKLRDAGLKPVQSLYTYGPYGATAWRWLIKRPMQMLGATWASVVVLPLYYLVALPIGLWFNAQDMAQENATGTGLLVVAQKPTGEATSEDADAFRNDVRASGRTPKSAAG